MINTAILGDCLDVMGDIPDKSIDMVLCDLPYGVTKAKWDVIIPFEPLWEHYERIIKPTGAIALTATQPFTSKLILSRLKLFKYTWVWNKSKVTGFLNAKKQPLRHLEDVCVFYKKQCTYNPQGLIPVNKTITNITDTEVYGDINAKPYTQKNTKYPKQLLNFPKTSNNAYNKNKSIHTTQKPLELLKYLIRTYTHEGETVLDNAAGCMSTALACIETNRNYICIEKDVDIYNRGIDRLNGFIRNK